MTTIAFANGVMAADCCMTDENRLLIRFMGKVRRLKGNRLAGFAGSVNGGLKLLTWLDDMRGTLNIEGDPIAMVAYADGRIFSYDSEGVGVEIADQIYAIGSGSHLAMGAMMAGADAVSAVEIAIERDGGSNFGVTSLSFEGTKPRSRGTKK